MNQDIEKVFLQLVEDMKNNKIAITPNQQEKLEMYALFKQATEGNVTGDEPGITNFAARLKYLSWAKIKDTPPQEAMKKYIDLTEKLKK